MAGGELTDAVRGGLTGLALGEALGLPWIGVGPRDITRARLLDGVGPTGAGTAAALAAARGGIAGAEAPPTGDPPPAGIAALPVALALGWRHDDRLERRAAVLPLGFAAVVVAELGAWAIQGRALHHLVAEHAKDWVPPFRGVVAEPGAIVDAVLANLFRHDDPTRAMEAAVRLGGDGVAVVTALVGGIQACRRPSAVLRVPWRGRVDLVALGLGHDGA